MAKQSGLGDRLLVAGYDLSGDTGAIERIAGGPALQEVPGINVSAMERIGLLRDGSIAWTAWFNKATDQAHSVLADLPTTDVHVMYLRGTALGNPAAACIGKQINYDPQRGEDGSLTIGVEVLANAYGTEWGQQLTAGLRTDTAATNGSSVDGGTSMDAGASSSFGLQAYLQVTAFSGTSVTVTVQDSADNSSFSAVTGAAFTAVSAARNTQRIATATNQTVRRYLRIATTGTFSNAEFAVMVVRNTAAPAF
jgi:hypothetical protein